MKTQNTITNTLKTIPQITAAYLHGSSLQNSIDANDIDIAIIGDDIPLENLISLKQTLSNTLNKKVDLAHITHKTNPYFAHRVFNQGKRLIDQNPLKRIEFETHMEMRYFDTQYQRDQATQNMHQRLGVNP